VQWALLFRFEYDLDKNTVERPAIIRDPSYVTDVAPLERWNYELMERGGEERMRALVKEVKTMCSSLANRTCLPPYIQRDEYHP
jgi:hypothetical protein